MSIFVISDHHLNQEKILTFFKDDANTIPLRNFKNIDEMHGKMIRCWNSVVNPKDKIYVLGDITWDEAGLVYLNAMNGRKILIKGNHDNLLNCRKYLPYFDDIQGIKHIYHKGINMVLSHVPIHPDCLKGRWDLNIHGHLHANIIKDDRYYNVSVEQVNYTPVNLDDISEKFLDDHDGECLLLQNCS